MAYSKTEGSDGELVVYGASGLGACPVALYYDRQGVSAEPTPDWLQVAYNQGNDNEGLILSMFQESSIWTLLDKEQLSDAGFRFGEYDEDRKVDYSEQVRVEAGVLPGVVVRAHLDGIGRVEIIPDGWQREQDKVGDLFVIEVKALGDALWDKWKKSKDIGIVASYPWQVSAQMKGAGLPLVFVVGHKGKDGRVFEIDYKVIDEPPVKWMEVIKKIGKVESGNIDDTDCPVPFMYPCPFYPLHNPDLSKGAAGLIVLNDENSIQQERVLFLSLAEEVERHRVEEKRHQELKNKAQQACNEWLDKHEFRGMKIDVGPYVINDVVQDKDGNPSASKMQEDGINVDKYRNPGYTVRFITVTRKNAGKEGKEGKGKGDK